MLKDFVQLRGIVELGDYVLLPATSFTLHGNLIHKNILETSC